MKTAITKRQARRAHTIKASLGVRYAAGYLRNLGHSLNVALFVLVGVAVRPQGGHHE